MADAAAGDEHDERSDDRLDLETGDEPAVERAEQAGTAATRNDKSERVAERRIRGTRPNELKKISGASAPDIAISEPTERSMPPVAMTSVMPTETMTIVAT